MKLHLGIPVYILPWKNCGKIVQQNVLENSRAWLHKYNGRFTLIFLSYLQ